MDINYSDDTKRACSVSYGIPNGTTTQKYTGLAPVLDNKDIKFTKDFVDKTLCNIEDPFLLISSNPFHTKPTEIQLRNARACLIRYVYRSEYKGVNKKNTEYEVVDVHQKIDDFLTRYTEALKNKNVDSSLERQTILDECTRTADPIDMLSECQQQCMWSEYKTNTGGKVFYPHDVIKQLQLLKKSINEDLNIVNNLLKDSGKITLAQMHQFRGKNARRDKIRNEIEPNNTLDISKIVTNTLKKYGKRGTHVKSDALHVANRLKKQRKKKIRNLFELVQKQNTGNVQDNLKEYFTMNRVLNMNTKSFKMNRRPGAGNYYRPAKKRQTTPELRLKKQAIDSIMKRYRHNPMAFGAKSLLNADFPQLNRPLRLKGTGVTQGGDRKDYSRLSNFGVKERAVPKNNSIPIQLRTSNKKGKGLEIDVCNDPSNRTPCLFQDEVEHLHGMTMRDLRDMDRGDSRLRLPLISSGDYIKQKLMNKTYYLRIKFNSTEQKMILGQAGQTLLNISDLTIKQRNEGTNPINASLYPLTLADGNAKTFKQMSKYLSTLIQNKFIEAILLVNQTNKPVYLDKRIATDKEIYLPHATTIVKRNNVAYYGLITRDGGNDQKQNKYFVEIPPIHPQIKRQYIDPKPDGVYFMLHETIHRVYGGPPVLTASSASAQLRRFVRDTNLKNTSQDLKMWATKNHANTRNVMLSPISPILDYVREKRGKSRLSYKYNEALKGSREKERRRRLPLRIATSRQIPTVRYNVGVQRAIPVNTVNPELGPVQPAIPLAYAF